jgi:NAD(P)-dependent dehydrogenase (short-subunit alcohol dehydrogenase family)
METPVKTRTIETCRVLEGMTALVTGAGSGIGEAIAHTLAGAGALVYVADRDLANGTRVAEEIANQKGRAEFVALDVTDEAALAAMAQRVEASHGGLDILVNNAGVAVSGAVGDANADTAALARQDAVNVHGVISAIRTAAQLMGEGGRIVTIGSGIATRASFPGLADYAATKAAIVGYSKGASRDLGPRGITVNVLQPGSIDTDMNPKDGGDFAEAQRSQHALQRFGTAEEIAAGIVFLTSPQASFVTGTVLNVDGGFGA